MSSTELVVVVVGLAIGFWAVSFFMGQRKPAPQAAPQTTDAAPGWHEVLEVSPGASVDEIRAAYRQLMSQYHPDKVATLGAELRALAERKSAQINAAYRDALKSCGVEE